MPLENNCHFCSPGTRETVSRAQGNNPLVDAEQEAYLTSQEVRDGVRGLLAPLTLVPFRLSTSSNLSSTRTNGCNTFILTTSSGTRCENRTLFSPEHVLFRFIYQDTPNIWDNS